MIRPTALALLLMSPVAVQAQQTIPPVLALEWTLAEVDGQPIGFSATISVDAEGRITGRAPCNRYFTPAGCQEYRDALIRIGNLESVKAKRLTVRAVVVKPPIILNKVLQGQTQRFAWHLQMEVLLSYLSSAEQTAQPLVVTVVVVRRALTETEQGVGIEKYVASAGGS